MDNAWNGDYYFYVAPTDSSEVLGQNIHPFGRKAYEWDQKSQFGYQRIDLDDLNRTGVYVLKGVAGLPDLLVSTRQTTGGGALSIRVFYIQNEQIHQLRFMDKSQRMTESFEFAYKPLRYLDDGTICLSWWSNVGENKGVYDTVYMLDLQNAILMEAYTQKIK